MAGEIESNKSAYASFTETEMKRMSYLEYDMTNYVYDMPPLASNSFYVASFGEQLASPEQDYRVFDNAMFRVQGVEFSLPSIEYEEHQELNMELLKSVKFSKTMSLTWLEDAYRSVQKYHFDWLTHFYNKQGDYLVNGAKGKFRNCTIILFHTRQQDGGLGMNITTPTVEPILKLEVRGMQVKNFGGLSLKYGSPQSDQTLKIDYSIISCNMKYNVNYNIAGTGGMKGRSDALTKGAQNKVLWAPLTENDNGNSSELQRMGLTTTQLLNGEGLIG